MAGNRRCGSLDRTVWWRSEMRDCGDRRSVDSIRIAHPLLDDRDVDAQTLRGSRSWSQGNGNCGGTNRGDIGAEAGTPAAACQTDSMYRDVAVQEPDSESNGVDHSVSLIYAARAEADLHRPERARKDLEQAQQIMEHLVELSPKHQYFRNTLEEAQAALKALPKDTAPIAVH